jgi:hypothetical protein
MPGDLAVARDLEKAFDAALAQVERLLAAGMNAADGESARPQLEKLEKELKLERGKVLDRGTVDLEWFKKTVREVIEWVPDEELALVAALGGIVRVSLRK